MIPIAFALCAFYHSGTYDPAYWRIDLDAIVTKHNVRTLESTWTEIRPMDPELEKALDAWQDATRDLHAANRRIELLEDKIKDMKTEAEYLAKQLLEMAKP